MALAGKGIDIAGISSNPGTFNQWLRKYIEYDTF
jgi:hypothetical protein